MDIDVVPPPVFSAVELDGSGSGTYEGSVEAQKRFLFGPVQRQIRALDERLGGEIDRLGAGEDRLDDVGRVLSDKS